MAMRVKKRPAKKKATAPKARKPRASSNGHGPEVLDIPVEFGGVSIGDGTARLGISIDRKALNLNAADETFCGHRLTGQVILGGNDESSGQAYLFDDLHERLAGTFDVKRVSVNTKSISTGLTFSLADIDIGLLARFSKGSGRLVVNAIAELPVEADEDDEEDDDARELPGTLKAEGPWRDVQLDTLFTGALLKSLKKAGLSSVGELADYSASEKRLTDIEGVGEGKAAQIENRMLQFWGDNPNVDKAE